MRETLQAKIRELKVELDKYVKERARTMAQSAPGKHFRKGIKLMELFQLFPDDETAEEWFVENRWPDGLRCAHCEGDNVAEQGNHPQMPFHCRDCRRFFSVKTNSFMHSSKVGYQKWVVAVYLITSSLKGVSSMKLHRDIGVTQKTAWHMLHRIRAFYNETNDLYKGEVEVNESYFGGKESNKHAKDKLNAGVEFEQVKENGDESHAGNV